MRFRALAVGIITAAWFALPMSSPVAAQQAPARFEILAGLTPFGCSEGCGAGVVLDGGATGWLMERLGVSGRLRGDVPDGISGRAELLLRTRAFVGESRAIEVDLGVGRGFPIDDFYDHSWKAEVLVGFRPYSRVGFKVGAEMDFFFKARNADGSRSRDSEIVANFLVVFRP